MASKDVQEAALERFLAALQLTGWEKKFLQLFGRVEMLVLIPPFSGSRLAIPVSVFSVLTNLIPDTSDNAVKYSPEEKRHGCYTQWARLVRVSKLRWSTDIVEGGSFEERISFQCLMTKSLRSLHWDTGSGGTFEEELDASMHVHDLPML